MVKNYWDDWEGYGCTTHLTVFEEEAYPEDTGLLFPNGQPIYKFSPKDKIGFDLT